MKKTGITSDNIFGATVLLSDGCDKVHLKTDLTCPFSLNGDPDQTPLQLSFDTGKNRGIAYCRSVLGIEPTIIDIRRKTG